MRYCNYLSATNQMAIIFTAIDFLILPQRKAALLFEMQLKLINVLNCIRGKIPPVICESK